MITNRGKTQIGRYFGHAVPQIARGISVGIGTATPTANDTQLEFEVATLQIESITYDPVNQRPVFKATLPNDLAMTVTEIGLWSDLNANPSGESDSRTLVLFEDGDETWDDAATFVAGSPLGGTFLRQTAAANGTTKNTISGSFDLSGFTGDDSLTVAYSAESATLPSSARVKFYTDSANYITFSLGALSAGTKKFSTFLFSTGVATGSPDLSNITYIDFETSSTAGSSSKLDWHGLRVKDTAPNNDNLVLIAREVITPFEVVPGRLNEIEFALYLDFV